MSVALDPAKDTATITLAGPIRPGRYSHSDATLYTLLVALYTKYTGGRQNETNVRARL